MRPITACSRHSGTMIAIERRGAHSSCLGPGGHSGSRGRSFELIHDAAHAASISRSSSPLSSNASARGASIATIAWSAGRSHSGIGKGTYVVSAPSCATISRMLQNAGVFLASLLILAWGAGVPGIATSYVDPVAHILAQDEAVYASTSLEMAAHGEWLSPKYLGRWAFYKPPLLYWLSAICVKVAGASTFALRFPSILAGAASVALV